MAWQLPCRGSTTQRPANRSASRNSVATGTLSRPAASFSTMTTAKRRSVRWLASDSSVRRKCCGLRKQGMHITVVIEGSSERDVATGARAAGGIRSEIFIGHCPDPVLARDVRGGGRSRRRPYRRCHKYGHSRQRRCARNVPGPRSWSRSRRNHAGCASIDMPMLSSARRGPEDMQASLQYPVQLCALLRRIPAKVNAKLTTT